MLLSHTFCAECALFSTRRCYMITPHSLLGSSALSFGHDTLVAMAPKGKAKAKSKSKAKASAKRLAKQLRQRHGQSNSRSQRSSTSRVECAEAYIREYVARHVAGSPCWRVGRNYKREEKTFPCLNQTGEGFSSCLYCGKIG